MANDTNVRGAFPITAPGAPPKLLYIRANTAVAIFRGQFVYIDSNGRAAITNADTSVTSNTAVGVAMEFLDLNRAGLPSAITGFGNSSTQGPFLPASTDAVVGITYDPFQLYLMEEDTGGNALTLLSNGQTAGWTYQATTGSNVTGYANQVIDRSTIISSTANLLQLIAVHDVKNQDGTDNAPGDYCKWIVRIQRHQLGTAWLPVPLG